ncbi:MAG: Unknown protein [uncultured Sulfurovum sp.]|uniref:Fibronectin type-III domain-containing protein n=1 Tax=uncultured Sulfurovum sp. TaxID=269237 RepID=A0A6S6TNP8_9BACT|nr:MAG: Unknown protein [uncultured Sulfurovum sp.]
MKTIRPIFFIISLLYLLTSLLLAEVDQYEVEAYDYFLEEEREKSLQLLEELEQKVPSLTPSSNTKSSSPVRILPLGDSITFGIFIGDTRTDDSMRHSYRSHLWYKLQDAGYSVNFVGRRNTGWDVSPSFDGDNDGYPGATTYDINGYMNSILSATNPDIILIHLGTNDQSTNVSGLNSILDKIDTYETNNNHDITVVLARILGSTDENHPGRDAIFAGYNSNLVNLANSRINNGDDIVIVNMYSGAGIYYDSRDMADYLHPTDSGYAKMATVWFNALENILGSPTPSQPTNFQSTSITHNSVTLTWTDNSNNETAFKIYNGNTRLATLSANVTQHTLSNLQPNTSYTLAIVSSNGNGNSNTSYVTFTTDPLPIPAAPSNLQVSALETSAALLQWQDNATYESGFKIYADNVHIATVGSNVTQYQLSNLITRTAYTYSVTAYNSSGESSTSSVSFTTKDDYGWLPAVYHVILN